MTKPTIVIIAGGENSRFSPLNTKTHKGFLSLAGRPIVANALNSLKKHGFTEIVLVISTKDQQNHNFLNYLENNTNGLKITRIVQDKPTGMGDAILLAKQYLEEHFVVATPYYSNLGEIVARLWQQKQETHADCVFSGTHVEKIGIYGILQFDLQNPQKVIGIEEKPIKKDIKSAVKIDSIYLFNQAFISELSETKKNEYSLETAIKRYCENNNCTWIENNGVVQSLKYPWHLFNLFNQIISKQKTSFAKSAQIADTALFDDSRGPIIIDERATIGDFAKLVGPCYVGRNCLVGEYSFVRGSSVEEGAVIGANTEIVRSILFENSSIHYGYLADSIIGHNTKIGAGLITANKRLDRKTIRMEVKKELINTDTNTLGIITGENVTIGIRVSTMPGITIAANAEIHPNVTISRNVPVGEKVKK